MHTLRKNKAAFPNLKKILKSFPDIHRKSFCYCVKTSFLATHKKSKEIELFYKEMIIFLITELVLKQNKKDSEKTVSEVFTEMSNLINHLQNHPFITRKRLAMTTLTSHNGSMVFTVPKNYWEHKTHWTFLGQNCVPPVIPKAASGWIKIMQNIIMIIPQAKYKAALTKSWSVLVAAFTHISLFIMV